MAYECSLELFCIRERLWRAREDIIVAKPCTRALENREFTLTTLRQPCHLFMEDPVAIVRLETLVGIYKVLRIFSKMLHEKDRRPIL